MERIYTIGTFTFKLIYDEKLIKIPSNFQIFESQEEPEYTYEFIVSETLPQIEGRVVSQRDELLILDCDGLETRYLGIKGSDWYYGVYQELTPHSARSIILKDTLGELYVDPFFCSFFSLEKKLLEKDALVLHCSYMQYKDYAILFSAPSGTGKTTQATLWEEYKGSHVVNGDKGLLMKDDGVWTAHGWPVCGSSGVCHNKNVPIKCVVMLSQEKENKIERLSPIAAFKEAYSQLTVNRWDKRSVLKSMDLLQDLIDNVPFYHLGCTISKEAVETLEKVL